MVHFLKRRLCFVSITAVCAYFIMHSSVALSQDFTTVLMQSTFQIAGPSQSGKPGEITTGTVFILGKPVPGKPNFTLYTLVTAAHVLEGIRGNVGTLQLRRQASDGRYEPMPIQIVVRNGPVNLYIKHPTADIAVMHLSIPDGVIPKVIGTELLANDEELKRIEVHPGDTLFCLGFPLNVSLESFSVVRSGILASYPITPARIVGKYFYNFSVFPGNSGGPVFYIYENRKFGNALLNVGMQIGIIGLVSQSVSSESQKMDISVIVPAVFIQEAIDLLPPPSSK